MGVVAPSPVGRRFNRFLIGWLCLASILLSRSIVVLMLGMSESNALVWMSLDSVDEGDI